MSSLKRPPESLTDGTVLLTRAQPSDVDEVCDAVQASVAELSVWMPWAHPTYSYTDAATWLARSWLSWEGLEAFEYVIRDAHDGRLLGTVGLNFIHPTEKRANLGYWVKTAEAGRGVATAAARLVARAGLTEVGLARIKLYHAAGNVGSQRVAEKVGFIYEGTMRARVVLHGRRMDALLYALIHPDEIRA